MGISTISITKVRIIGATMIDIRVIIVRVRIVLAVMVKSVTTVLRTRCVGLQRSA